MDAKGKAPCAYKKHMLPDNQNYSPFEISLDGRVGVLIVKPLDLDNVDSVLDWSIGHEQLMRLEAQFIKIGSSVAIGLK